ncbi:formimidoylglutamase [Dermatophilus congolensis]|uniref:formimidoylglutamase n=1 Tax=Dermatophilus congolensis TaxID=1863 RepID=UPI001AB0237E|nr:formimidoylglutamase [Dermatophilus congolensis]MBO3154676.1 formimidoylglutamase [Dermatophilus congolensis]MBO3188538.1 formimidoylglutamase [Dermatophilus congolensis]
MSDSEAGASVWQGRFDGHGREHWRWHQRVCSASMPSADAGGVALVGFASDEGVRRNGGRVGAAAAPDALRAALAPMAVHTQVPLFDGGTVAVVGEDLESGQAALGQRVADLVESHRLVVVLGGGHETAWGSYVGRVESSRWGGARVGVLNLDAHFDLRQADRPTSGTPFLQMAAADAAAGRVFDYTVVGIAQASNTRVLFDTADALGVRYVLDTAAGVAHLPALEQLVDDLAARVDAIHLSIDLDVLPAAVAPGVSAPAGFGVPVEVVEALCRRVAATGKLVVLDVVELCPRLDIDGRTARTAARLITTCVHSLPGVNAQP